MIKFEAIESNNFSQDNSFISKRTEKSYSNIFTLASNLCYSKEENKEPAQLGNTLVSIF